MHAVARGKEPARLKKIRAKLTPKWVQFYQHKKGDQPSDSRWREFQPELSRAFFCNCGYCEETCSGEVEHFRPKSRFPARVYKWSNWILACHTCNHKKATLWPRGGYVDPCAKSPSAKPEAHFAFDTKTGEIVAKPSLPPSRHGKAAQMIGDLGLNDYYHLKKRIQWLMAVKTAVAGDDPNDPGHVGFIRYVISRERELSSITRAFLRECGYPVAND